MLQGTLLILAGMIANLSDLLLVFPSRSTVNRQPPTVNT
ncbi:hypothetical protein PCC9214_04439 [Planktothrix tepida]|uniref:Uncharacterized protein n=2 Tax=Planktothrix TaxID=54304 RepID=A0A1J1LU60_9CYAN|nr:hypothetical protein NO713_01195 [Planktothrix pseudagardhii]CAD5978883.1 hypothetical protein PCC9214_04439 [Planktothrix tepida]CUR36139.1 hypothetical protein PL921480249 [Planktothrix tepida PCC 9214]